MVKLNPLSKVVEAVSRSQLFQERIHSGQISESRNQKNAGLFCSAWWRRGLQHSYDGAHGSNSPPRILFSTSANPPPCKPHARTAYFVCPYLTFSVERQTHFAAGRCRAPSSAVRFPAPRFPALPSPSSGRLLPRRCTLTAIPCATKPEFHYQFIIVQTFGRPEWFGWFLTEQNQLAYLRWRAQLYVPPPRPPPIALHFSISITLPCRTFFLPEARGLPAAPPSP